MSQRRLTLSCSWIVAIAYVSLAVWMHVWALEAGLPSHEESSTPHHQVCTWIGTSGEAGCVSGHVRFIPALISVEWIHVFSPLLVLPSILPSLDARAPPLSFL